MGVRKAHKDDPQMKMIFLLYFCFILYFLLAYDLQFCMMKPARGCFLAIDEFLMLIGTIYNITVRQLDA